MEIVCLNEAQWILKSITMDVGVPRQTKNKKKSISIYTEKIIFPVTSFVSFQNANFRQIYQCAGTLFRYTQTDDVIRYCFDFDFTKWMTVTFVEELWDNFTIPDGIIITLQNYQQSIYYNITTS